MVAVKWLLIAASLGSSLAVRVGAYPTEDACQAVLRQMERPNQLPKRLHCEAER